MKKITRAGILSLAFVVALMFTAALDVSVTARRYFTPADKDHVLTQRISIQAKHQYDYKDYPVIHLSRHELTLQKGNSYTLKASLLPSGKSVAVKWASSNPKIAKVSSSGKVTAIAPGTAMIRGESEDYFDFHVDETGYSAECCVTVPGGSKDVKPIGTSDWAYSYGQFKFTAVTNKHGEAIAKIKKSIGGYPYSDSDYGTGLLFGSKNSDIAHTYIYVLYDYIYGFIAKGNSPLKTTRGIMAGAKKSTVQQKYGLPTSTGQYTEEGIAYEYFRYTTKAPGKNLYTDINFTFLKSKGIVYSIDFYLGGFGDF